MTKIYFLDRLYWQHLDPIYLSEGLFAIANVFTFTRLCFYLPANEQLGPLEITLGKMINVCYLPLTFNLYLLATNR